ncbi:hypothetical protein [Gluconacetobacter azotocaptans]|uniref:hypothetical protein n=1 Tax=Gluconacetobacter azotocaptans TaxID=142834 RepID=UPI0021568D55|nr:hypothetical protein [Gluconacetobacter azotocaptans]GBQ34691.1 hypothetical protein AA13594_2934 [Gluconacetobacter azotocaptans DSM 13594]
MTAVSASLQSAPAPVRLELLDLEDFGAAPATDADTAAAEADAVPDPDLVTMTHAQVDAVRESAFREGLEKGSRDKEEALQARFAACVSSLTAAFSAENEQRNQVLSDAANAFLLTVTDVVSSLTALDGTVLAGLQRDLISDASAFAKECEGAVTVQCGEADAQRLQATFKDDANVRIEVAQDAGADTIRVVSVTNTIVIDPEQWRKSVAEKIIAAVTALARQRGEQSVQKA